MEEPTIGLRHYVMQCEYNTANDFIAPFIDIPKLNDKYLAMHKVQMHGGAISKLLNSLCLYGR